MKGINRLEAVFREHDLYNREIARYLNKSEETISRWVNNHRQPSIEDMNKIAEYLKIDIRELLNASDWSKSSIEPYKSKNK